MNDRTDAELIQAAESEAAAFAELYRRHVPTVHAWFRGRLEWAASDLTAEAFAQAWLSRRSFRDEADGSALPWLLGIARNVARESARRNAVEKRARRRLGLPTDLASEDGYAAVEELRFPVYEELPVDPESMQLLDLEAQHPSAQVVRDPAAYIAAEARLYPHG